MRKSTHQIAGAVRPLLAGTVWQYYELISTQWPTDGSGAVVLLVPDAEVPLGQRVF